eukprot:XP_001706636.1 Hypothetical protein GL50803_35780 [Giardia lamblia ATCC 50803]
MCQGIISIDIPTSHLPSEKVDTLVPPIPYVVHERRLA